MRKMVRAKVSLVGMNSQGVVGFGRREVAREKKTADMSRRCMQTVGGGVSTYVSIYYIYMLIDIPKKREFISGPEGYLHRKNNIFHPQLFECWNLQLYLKT